MIIRLSSFRFLSVGLPLALAAFVRADVTPNALFCDHAVLQRDTAIPVWGKADPGEKITVRLSGKIDATAIAGPDGRWWVRLPAQPAGGPFKLVIEGRNRIELSDVWVGEVWLCGGQSNMERELGLRRGQQPIDNWEQEVAAADYPQIRHFAVERTPASTPLDDTGGRWDVCSPATVGQFTAVGYFFARDLHRQLRVPVGLIHSSWGGAAIESWMSPEAFTAATGQPLPPLVWRNKHNRPSSLYQGMIAPLQPYAIRGVIWYQGESNAPRAEAYRVLFPSLIADWRKQWGQGNFPFLFVQLAPHRSLSPEIRDAQLHAWEIAPNTAMIVTTDIGDAADIHPPHKAPVGARLSLAARALAYGEKIEYSGPRFSVLSIEGSRAVLRFDHPGGGLVAKDGPLRGFTISGDGNEFVPAKAVIVGDTVVASAGTVVNPVAVRYGWANVPDGNLFNAAGLPASPFRAGTGAK